MSSHAGVGAPMDTAPSSAPPTDSAARPVQAQSVPDTEGLLPKAVPVFFVVPCRDPVELEKRVLIAHHVRMQPYIESAAHYTGGDPHRLEQQLEEWLVQHWRSGRAAHLVVVINAHGNPDREGAVEDVTQAGRRIWWRPTDLWRGFHFQSSRQHKEFVGLRSILLHVATSGGRAPPLQLDVVFSQCYGQRCAAAFAADVQRHPLPPAVPVRVVAHGLGDGKTWLVLKRPEQRHRYDRSEYSYHRELLAWFQAALGPRPPPVRPAAATASRPLSVPRIVLVALMVAMLVWRAGLQQAAGS